MVNIKQTIFSGSIKKVIMVSLVLLGPLAITPVQAGKGSTGGGGGSTFCPCFSSTIIDAEISEGQGRGISGLLNGSDGGFTCYDDGNEVFLSFSNLDNSVNLTVFGELTGTPGPGCGWSGRPVDTTEGQAAECQNQIKQSWAWQVLGCPKL